MANSAVVGLLRVLLTANTAEFDSNLDKSKAKAKSWSTEVGSFGKSIAGSLFPVATAAGAGVALVALGKQAVEAAGRIQDLSTKLGTSTDFIQKLDYVSGQTGSSLESFANAAFKLGANLANGTKTIDDAVGKLGLNLADLQSMRPEEQFEAIAKALSEMESPQERNAVALKLFGKTASEVIPAIVEKYTQLAAQAPKASAANVATLDAMGDAWDDAKKRTGAAAISIIGWWTRISQVAILPSQLISGPGSAGDLPQVASAFQKIAEAGQKRFLDPNNPKDLAELDTIAQRLTKSVSELGPRTVAVAKATDTWHSSIVSINRSGFAMLGWLEPLKPALQDAGAALQNIGEGFTEEGFLRSDSIEEAGRATAEATKETLEWANAHGAVLAPSIEQSTAEIEEATSKTRQWGTTLGDVLLRIPGLLQNAFTGGGGASGFGKALASLFGQSGIGKLFEKDGLIGKQLTGLGKLFGDSFVPGLGQALGSLLPLAFSGLKKLFGIGINDEVKKANKEIDILKDGLLATYGTLEDLERAANAVGLSFKANWGHQGRAGLEAFQKLIDEFQGKLSDSQEDLNGKLADTNQELDRLIEKGRELGYVFDREGNLIEVRFEKMRDIADQFGIDLESLGPKFQGQRLASDAKGIIDAFTLLEKGGVSVGAILVGLKDEIGKLVGESIKFGTTIPANMKPWIQNLIDTGQLIDADGQKITDMAAINFGPPIESEFDIVQRAIRESVQAINELIAKINDLINTIMGIPDRTVTITEKLVTDDQRTAGDLVGDRDNENIGFSLGGLIPRTMRATVHQGELIGPVDFMSRALRGAIDSSQNISSMLAAASMGQPLAGATAGGQSGSPVSIVNHFSFDVHTLDTDEMSRLIRRRIMPEINSQLSTVGELRSANRDALGI